jgi:hypothetical protein
MGWAQLPDIIVQPKDGKGKDYFVEQEARKSTLTMKGVLGFAFLGLSLVVFYYTLGTSYWFLGIALMALVVIFFWWSIITNRTPADLKSKPSK